MKQENARIIYSALWPVLFVALLWLVKFTEINWQISLVEYGLKPRDWVGIRGIFLAPLIHGDFKHLFNNSLPLLILGWSVFYFYREISFKLILWIVVMGGLWTWISARPSFHIGASGLLYGLFSFVMVSGFIRRNTQLMAISFLVAFVYGSLVWGILPIDYKISWESHFWGFLSGIVLAVYYRKKGLQKKVYLWEDEDEEEDGYWNQPQQQYEIRYSFKPNDSNQETED